MILEARNQIPFIHFGFNRISAEGFTNEKIYLYLKNIYNADNYTDRTVILSGGSFVKINNYKYELNFSELSSYTAQLRIIDKNKNITLFSNVLNINITSPTWDNETITFDSTKITFDKE